MAERITKETIKRENGYLYYLGKDGYLWKTPTKLNKSGRKAKVGTEKIVRQAGYMYFLDKKGYVCRARMIEPTELFRSVEPGPTYRYMAGAPSDGMPDAETAARYLQARFSQWAFAEGSAQIHIQRLGRAGLANEFRVDPAFGDVCEFVKLAGRLQLRSDATQAAEGALSDVFGVPFAPLIEIVLAAVADACGYKYEGDELAEAAVKGIAAFVGVAIIGGVLAALLSRK